MIRCLVVALLLMIAGLSPAHAEQVSLSGQVTYREPIDLPPEAVLRVRLVDAGRLDAPAVVEAQSAIPAPGKIPLTFTLSFDSTFVEPGRNYAITAEITSGDALWFSSFSPHPVDPLATTAPEPVMLTFAGRLGGTAAVGQPPPPAPRLLDLVWQAVALHGHPLDPALDISLSIAGDLRAGGRGGCNSYFAQAWMQGEQLQFSTVGATKMACLDPDAGAREAEFFAALEGTRFWRVAGAELQFLDETGAELVRFRASSDR
jgi:putative lipoprotein